jgi:Flp pilus assembly protein TadB
MDDPETYHRYSISDPAAIAAVSAFHAPHSRRRKRSAPEGHRADLADWRRAAWREFVSQHWAWLRQKISYKAFEEAMHHVFENGMAWVFRKCRRLTPSAALLVILGAVLWLPISFGLATLLHAVLIAKATSLPSQMRTLHDLISKDSRISWPHSQLAAN